MTGRKPFFPKATSSQDQAKRLGSRFERIAANVAGLLSGVDVASSPANATPDRALVFEVKGPVADFVDAANRLGLEWLTEDILVAPSEDDDSEYAQEGGRRDVAPLPHDADHRRSSETHRLVESLYRE